MALWTNSWEFMGYEWAVCERGSFGAVSYLKSITRLDKETKGDLYDTHLFTLMLSIKYFWKISFFLKKLLFVLTGVSKWHEGKSKGLYRRNLSLILCNEVSVNLQQLFARGGDTTLHKSELQYSCCVVMVFKQVYNWMLFKYHLRVRSSLFYLKHLIVTITACQRLLIGENYQSQLCGCAVVLGKSC